MKTVRVSRSLIVFIVTALAAVAFTAVAVASSRDTRPHLMPDRLVGAPELSAVIWDTSTSSFVQWVFDRGRITAISASAAGGTTSGTITVQQGAVNHPWRTQTFTVPTTTSIRLNES